MLTCQPRITPLNPRHERWNHGIHRCMTLMHLTARCYSSLVNCLLLPVTTTKNKARNSLCQSRQTEHSLQRTPMYTLTNRTKNLYDSRQLSSFHGRHRSPSSEPDLSQALSLIRYIHTQHGLLIPCLHLFFSTYWILVYMHLGLYPSESGSNKESRECDMCLCMSCNLQLPKKPLHLYTFTHIK